MDRRRSKRWPRQLEVRFWKRGDEPQATRATSINISRTGIFVRTSLVLPSGTRLTLEVNHGGHGFVAEGVVMRALRTPTHLQAVMPSGMGVRFMTPEELIEELLPGVNLHVEEQVHPGVGSPSGSASVDPPSGVAGAAAAASISPTPTHMPTPAAVASAAATAPTMGGAFRIGTPASVTGAAPAAHQPTAPPAPAPAPPRPPPQAVVFFPMRFRDLAQFERVFERDVQTGGLFISTERPAVLDAVIDVEVSVEGVAKPPVRVRARVVHRMEPQAGGPPGNLLAGMGVQFLDVPRTVDLLRVFLG